MTPAVAPVPSGPRERLLDSAYALFSRRGIRDVGVDELISHSGVAKATFYRHFSSKDDLVLAFLKRREERWTLGLIIGEAKRRGTNPENQLLAIFDVFYEWFQQDDFEACSFINVLLEMGPQHPLGLASAEYLKNIRTHVSTLADEAGLLNVEDFACSWHILMKGSIISAAEGDNLAALRAQRMGRSLIAEHRNRLKPVPA